MLVPMLGEGLASTASVEGPMEGWFVEGNHMPGEGPYLPCTGVAPPLGCR